jgi:hypothetical protein
MSRDRMINVFFVFKASIYMLEAKYMKNKSLHQGNLAKKTKTIRESLKIKYLILFELKNRKPKKY